MPAQQKQKVGNKHKARRSSRDKGYYTALRQTNEIKTIRRAKKRQQRQREYADGTRTRTKAQERQFRRTR